MKRTAKITKTWNWLTSGLPLRLLFFLPVIWSLKSKVVTEERWFDGLNLDSGWQVNTADILAFSAILCSLVVTAIIRTREDFLLRKHKNIEIEDRAFLEKDFLIFYLNCFLTVLGYLLLMSCFSSFLRALAVTALITVNYFSEKYSTKRRSTYRNFLSWSDQNTISIVAWNFLLAFSLPLVSQLFNGDYFSKVSSVLQSKNLESFKDLYNGLPFAGTVNKSLEIAKKTPLLAVFIYYARLIINQSISNLRSFWAEINAVERRKDLFKFFFNAQRTQSMAASAQKITEEKQQFVIIPCQGNYDNSPNFIKQKYVARWELSTYDFSSNLELVMIFIEAIEAHVSNQKEKNYLLSTMFKDYQSIEQTIAKKERLVKS